MNNPAKLQEQADYWNLRYPIGTPVIRYKLINPLSEGNETKTRSQAWVMGGHSVVVMVQGVSGGVLLESIVPIPPKYNTPEPPCEIRDDVTRESILAAIKKHRISETKHWEREYYCEFVKDENDDH
jgi:hypothetical protein